MNEINCVLCSNPIITEKYNLQEHTTLQTYTVLLHFLEYAINEQFVSNNYTICSPCFVLLNELEQIEIRAKEIKKVLTDLCQNSKKQFENNFFEHTSDLPQTVLPDTGKSSNTSINIVISSTQNALSKKSNQSKCVFECHICSKKFVSRSNHDSHIQKFHPDYLRLYSRNSQSSIHVALNGSIESNTENYIDENFLDHKPPGHVQGNNSLTAAIKCESSNAEQANEENISNEDVIKNDPVIKIKNEDGTENHETTSKQSESQNQKKRGRRKGCVPPKFYECKECSKIWKTQSGLKMHLLSHSETRPFICEICGQAYKHKSALDIHVGMHNGINPYTCVYCNKAFTQKGGLMRHVLIHTGVMNYQCDLCGKRFVHHTSFNVHKLSHSGEKAYKCEVCGLALMSKSHLKRHLRVHTGEKKYACSICGKKFAEKYNLATHEKLHNSGGSSPRRKYRCQFCSNTYDRKIKLEEHIGNEHPEHKVPPTLNGESSNMHLLNGREMRPDDNLQRHSDDNLQRHSMGVMKENAPRGGIQFTHSLQVENQYLRSLPIYTTNTM